MTSRRSATGWTPVHLTQEMRPTRMVKRRMQWKAPSKTLAVDDPLLLPEIEVHAEIGINWFLNQEIPRGGYVRILAESLLLGKRLGTTCIRTTEGLNTCMEPHRGWAIANSSWIFVRKRWLDREQELIIWSRSFKRKLSALAPQNESKWWLKRQDRRRRRAENWCKCRWSCTSPLRRQQAGTSSSP